MVRTVTFEALATAYQTLFPNEDTHGFLSTWLKAYEQNPDSSISFVANQQGKATAALFKALALPLPNTPGLAAFILKNPGLENRATQLVYVSASTEAGDNVDLIVRAVSREHAEISWRDHFADWDLPAEPRAITAIPVDGPVRPISWDLLTSAAADMVTVDAVTDIPSN